MQLPEESRQRIVRLFRADMEGLDGLLLDLREVEIYTPTVSVTRTFGEKLSDSLADGWKSFTRSIQYLILDLASALPALILLAVIIVVVIVLVKKYRKKRRARKAAQQPPQDGEQKTK